MFTSEMIAPCGLDCSLCLFAHDKERPCPGCNAESENKPDFCTKWCRIIPCAKRTQNGYRYCDECPDYPCGDMKQLEDRYATAYPLKESPMQNLRDIRELGMEPDVAPVRGGTDGAQLSFRGLPCPNLGTGGYAFHGPYEHITAEGMDMVVKILRGIVEKYSM